MKVALIMFLISVSAWIFLAEMRIEVCFDLIKTLKVKIEDLQK